MNDDILLHLLQTARTIAIIGAKDKVGHPVDRVGRYLMETGGYTVFPVHPTRKNVWGLPTFKKIIDITEGIHVVNVFRAPVFCLAHAKEALGLSLLPGLFWMQTGISNVEAATLLADRGIVVIENACIMVEHARLLGKLLPGNAVCPL